MNIFLWWNLSILTMLIMANANKLMKKVSLSAFTKIPNRNKNKSRKSIDQI